jgi:hypothetical protein
MMAAVDPNAEWIGNVQPVGLVLAANILARHGLNPAEQTRADSEAVRALLSANDEGPALPDPWAFFTQILGWGPKQVAGAPGGPPLPEELAVRVGECETDLAPHWAVTDPDKGSQILVRLEGAGVDPERRGSLEGWEATPHQQLERLLRETGVPTGLLVTDRELRLVHAPRGETSGWLKFPLRSLCEVGGRPMLGGLKLILSSFRLHNDAADRRLASLLKASRDAQAEVSTRLAAQVLGALYELLRGLHAADCARTEALAASRPEHLYEGLLTVLLRLVFLLYAEDRDLIPSRTDGEARALYDQGYGVRSLYMRLLDDAALHPDTMDERRGAWSRLLALFRLVHRGDGKGWIRGRGGKLFDPEAFPFLQGQDSPSDQPSPATLSDGCVLRVLDFLLNLDGERLSYRTLDVEQIGSVYETVMGFTVETRPGPALAIRAGKNEHTPVFVDVAALTATKGSERAKFLKEEADRGSLTDRIGKPLAAATDQAEVIGALRPIVDERASPGGHVARPGTPLLQPTDERRRTGSHYTPRTLTAPIVRHALEPAFARLGPDARPEAVLNLKICDPAMGSGAFLVEACRALGERLVQAWARWPETRPTVPPDEDEHLHARRLVAQRCLYGVDKNPRATDLAKLSLWLATLARDHEFTFLDHSLKSGDSLVGLTQEQIASAHWDPSKPGLPLFRQLVKDRVAEAMKGRAEIQTAPDDTARAIQEHRHRSLEERLKDVRSIGEAVVAAFFTEDKSKAREKRRAEVESWLAGSLETAWNKLAALVSTMQRSLHPLIPFHWEIEFPEVFARQNGGFDALVGNPPFLGGARIWPAYGTSYADWLRTIHERSGGKAVDLVAHFYRRAYNLLRAGGAFGLVGTKRVSEGDTREAGLKRICNSGGRIYSAQKRIRWLGGADVIVNAVHVGKETSSPKVVLDGREVPGINSFLFPNLTEFEASRLAANKGQAFRGCDIYGQGFLFCDEATSQHAGSIELMKSLLQERRNNAEVIFPYIGGQEVATHPKHLSHRFVINFADWPLERAEAWPELLSIVRAKVKPDRDKLAGYSVALRRKELWWQYGTYTPALYRAIADTDRVLAISRITTHICFAFLPSRMVFNEKLVILPARRGSKVLALLQSRVHETWALMWGSRLGIGDTPVYSPPDCLETFPYPADFDASFVLEEIGNTYNGERAGFMVIRNEGMTKTYNRFHDPSETADDIQRLRELQAAMDRAVLEAYGWHDLAAHAAPIFLDETVEDDHTYQGRLFWPSDFRDEVLARLLALNAERHAEEVRLGIAPGMGRKAETENEEVEEKVDA